VFIKQWHRPRLALTQIPTSDLDVTIIGQLATTQFAFDDHLEPAALKVEGFKAPLRGW
jgi:hypothetical protein